MRDRTIEKADINAGVANAGGQGFPNLQVRVRGILEISGGSGGAVSRKSCVLIGDKTTNMMAISSNAESVR